MKLGQLAEDILYLSEHGYEFECDPEPIGGSIWLEMPTIGLQIAYSADSEEREHFFSSFPDECECSWKIIRRPNVIDDCIVSIKQVDQIMVAVWDWTRLPHSKEVRSLVENLIKNSQL